MRQIQGALILIAVAGVIGFVIGGPLGAVIAVLALYALGLVITLAALIALMVGDRGRVRDNL